MAVRGVAGNDLIYLTIPCSTRLGSSGPVGRTSKGTWSIGWAVPTVVAPPLLTSFFLHDDALQRDLSVLKAQDMSMQPLLLLLGHMAVLAVGM